MSKRDHWVITGIIVPIVVVIASSAATVMVTKKIDEASMYTISPDRQIALKGTWSGTVMPIVRAPGAPDSFPVTYYFDPSSKVIKGTRTFVTWDNHRTVVDNFKGSFQNQDCFRIEYENSDKRVVGFGVGFFKLAPDARKIDGVVSGISSVSGTVFSAKVVLNPSP